MKIIDCEQNSDAWRQFRCGKITSSRFKDVLANGVGKAPSKTRQSYLLEKASEIITGQLAESFQSDAMAYGTLAEPEARQAYADNEQVMVEQVGCIEHPSYANVICSPDGLVSDDGLLEIKSPKTSTQIQRVLAGEFPSEYTAQVQGQLWVCDREWCDFLSYDGRIHGPAKYFKKRVYRDEAFIKKLSEGVELFIEDLNQLLVKINKYYGTTNN